MSVNALVVFRDGSTRVVEVPSPAPRDLTVRKKIEDTMFYWVVPVFRPSGSENAPIFEES